MPGKKLYQKYKGKKVEFDGMLGVVCGYDNEACCSYPLIMAIPEDSEFGWYDLRFFPSAKLKTHLDGYRYLWICERDIID